MINENFIAPSINIESLCEEAKGLDVVTETKEATIENILSNSFGFGGTNASLVISRY
jgi:3-oxoacyl-[acyl-carrier-protein] synthase-1